jgi:hypothetical protein
VFFLAFAGTAMEIFVQPTCPPSDAGTPLCFYSLGVASLLIIVFFIARKTAKVIGSNT